MSRPIALVVVVALVQWAAAAAAQDLPEYRDSRTGTVWVPQVSEDQGATMTDNSNQDRAFDPGSQHDRVPGVVVQHPRTNLMGAVPITAGPTVPVMTLDLPALRVIPARHWISVLYVTNNSPVALGAVVGCLFTNQGRTVEDTRVILPPAGPGQRLGLAVRGPRYDLFVDQVSCHLISAT